MFSFLFCWPVAILVLKWSGRACLEARVPTNVQAHIWHCLSVSQTVCPLGWMDVWLVNNQYGWLLIILSAAEAGGLTYHSSQSRSPCDVISLHLVTLDYVLQWRPALRHHIVHLCGVLGLRTCNASITTEQM